MTSGGTPAFLVGRGLGRGRVSTAEFTRGLISYPCSLTSAHHTVSTPTVAITWFLWGQSEVWNLVSVGLGLTGGLSDVRGQRAWVPRGLLAGGHLRVGFGSRLCWSASRTLLLLEPDGVGVEAARGA